MSGKQLRVGELVKFTCCVLGSYGLVESIKGNTVTLLTNKKITVTYDLRELSDWCFERYGLLKLVKSYTLHNGARFALLEAGAVRVEVRAREAGTRSGEIYDIAQLRKLAIANVAEPL